jgi:hypothetical protein
MAKTPKKKSTEITSIRHKKDTRVNIPTEELRDFVADDEKAPKASTRSVSPLWLHNGTMPVTLSIKNVPDRVVEVLRRRAKDNRRSLQGELLALVEGVAVSPAARSMTVEDLHEWAKAQGFPKIGNVADDIRQARAKARGRR